MFSFLINSGLAIMNWYIWNADRDNRAMALWASGLTAGIAIMSLGLYLVR